MKKRYSSNYLVIIFVLLIYTIGMGLIYIYTKNISLSILTAQDVLSIVIEQFVSAFLVVSVIAVLSDKSNIVLWENLMSKNLIEPVGFNLIDLSIYIVWTLVLSVTSFILKDYLLVVVLACIEAIILMIMVYKVLRVYFNEGRERKRLEKQYHKCKKPEIKKEKLEELYYRIVEKVNNGEYKRIDDDVVFFLMGVQEDKSAEERAYMDNKHLEYMAQSLIGILSQENPYIICRIFSKTQKEMGARIEEYKSYSYKYMNFIYHEYPEVFREIQYMMNHEWIEIELNKIRFCDKIDEKEEHYVENDDRLFESKYLLEFLNKYEASPLLIGKCIRHMENLICTEWKDIRTENPDYAPITYRNIKKRILLVSDEVFAKFDEILQSYKKAYKEIHYDTAEKECTKSCIEDILWLEYMQEFKQLFSRSGIIDKIKYFYNMEEEGGFKLKEPLRKNCIWYKSKFSDDWLTNDSKENLTSAVYNSVYDKSFFDNFVPPDDEVVYSYLGEDEDQ